jgi:hypothetical protein
MPPAPAPPPANPHRQPTDSEPLADAIDHYLDRRQGEEIGRPESPERPTTMRQRLLPVATTAIAVFVLAVALVLLFN